MAIENKEKLYPLAEGILHFIIENSEKPRNLSKSQEKARADLKKIYSEFEKTLTEEQKEYIHKLEVTNNSISATNEIYWMLYGMKVYKELQSALNEMADNPADIAKYYDDKPK